MINPIIWSLCFVAPACMLLIPHASLKLRVTYYTDAAEDAGCPVEDASGSDANGGHPDEDAGRVDEDAGHSDGGPGHPDEVAGGPEEDAGSPEQDAGRPDEPELLSVNNGRVSQPFLCFLSCAAAHILGYLWWVG